MKKTSSIIILISTVLFFITAKSQNNESDFKPTYIGEINPSANIGQVNGSDILDFDQGLLIIYSEREKSITLIDLSSKQFGKIAIKQRLAILDDSPQGLKQIYNFLNFNYKVFDFGESYVIVDYEKKVLSQVKQYGTGADGRTYFSTGQVFSNVKGDFIMEVKITSGLLYHTINKNGELLEIVKKNKKFISTCSYFRGLNRQVHYQETNPNCAFNNSIIHAKARKPKLYDDRGNRLQTGIAEKENIAFVDFYKDNIIVYTYNFNFDNGEVKDALISLDLKYLIVNNKFIYSLPAIEITK